MARLTVMNWNARSVNKKKKTEGLKDLLRTYNVDVAVITETFLEPGKEWSIPGYKIVRWDRAGRGGGVAILVRETIQIRELPATGTRVIESVGVELEDATVGKLKIFAVYFGEQGNRVTFGQTQFHDDLNKLTLTPGKYLIAGDLNAHHKDLGDDDTNKNGKELFNLRQMNDFTVYSSFKPTYISPQTNIPSKLDIFVANFGIDRPVAIDNDLSDHRPVICKIKEDSRGFLQQITSLYKQFWGIFRKISVQENQHDQETNYKEHSNGEIAYSEAEERDEEEVFEIKLDVPLREEVRKIVEKLHGKKNAGEHLLQSKLFYHGGNRLATGIQMIIKKIWNQDELTQRWIETDVRDGHICMNNCCTYSSDILLNATYRVLSGILFHRLPDAENRFIGQYQAGTEKGLWYFLKKFHQLKEPTQCLSNSDLKALYASVDVYGQPTELTLLIKATMDNLIPRNRLQQLYG